MREKAGTRGAASIYRRGVNFSEGFKKGRRVQSSTHMYIYRYGTARGHRGSFLTPAPGAAVNAGRQRTHTHTRTYTIDRKLSRSERVSAAWRTTKSAKSRKALSLSQPPPPPPPPLPTPIVVNLGKSEINSGKSNFQGLKRAPLTLA